MSGSPIDRKRIARSEEMLESAFWEFDALRKSKRYGESFAFKLVIRKRWPQWFEALQEIDDG